MVYGRDLKDRGLRLYDSRKQTKEIADRWDVSSTIENIWSKVKQPL